jgi:hypothetical protein
MICDNRFVSSLTGMEILSNRKIRDFWVLKFSNVLKYASKRREQIAPKTWYYIPGNLNLQLYRCENLTFAVVLMLLFFYIKWSLNTMTKYLRNIHKPVTVNL